ncbi:hypothetical protein DFR56_106145 [Pseudogracilibacillus auburnensis]|uniref:Uncharacterized protein n=1 Tax=Pseudogracilibacillus auburnensis TaxID=1494959 RepID=A0A2V3W495_9BACI|nr:hypothetical protein DFR56_106145 [Pseudogracilibacillus auburnensis]
MKYSEIMNKDVLKRVYNERGGITWGIFYRSHITRITITSTE